ncbi:MAG: AraC family transcriptional regulator [Arenicella sp.]
MIYQEPEFEMPEEDLISITYLEHGSSSSLVRWHLHQEYELHFISSGSGKVFIGDYVGDFSAGNIVLVGPNLPHNWVSNIDDESINCVRDKVIKFSQSTWSDMCSKVPELSLLDELLRESSYGIEFGSQKMNEYEPMFDLVRDNEGLLRVIHFFRLLQALSSDECRMRLSSQEFSENRYEKNQDLIGQAIQYIDNNYTQQLSLRDVSNHLGMSSPSVFSRFFHKATGVTYIEFIKKLRIGKACERLERSGDQITQICFDVGFSNVANFNRHFRVIKGMTPRQYRKSCKQKFYRGLR